MADATTFSPCDCDLNVGACDILCCCDTSCTTGLIERWELDNACTVKPHEVDIIL